jgi:hypothetical protein
LPSIISDKVESEYNPEGDGNCGFRSIAYALYGDGKRYDEIKNSMMVYLKAHKDWYLAHEVFMNEEIDKMNELLSMRGSVSSQHWFYSPDCCQLAADTFLNPIQFHSPDGAMLYLPFTSTSFFKTKPIILHLQAGHITLIKYKLRSQISHPRIYYIYERVCRSANISSRLPQYRSNIPSRSHQSRSKI